MKTYVTYGFFMALAAFLLNLVFYFAGFHSDPAKVTSTQWVSSLLFLILGIVITALGIRARRDDVPATEPFSYGRALGAGVMITLFACLFSIVTNLIYIKLLNTGFTDVLVQAKLDQMEAKGMSADQIEKIEPMLRKTMGPIGFTCFGFIVGMFFGAVISLVEAAILKRPATDSALPPPI